MSNMNTIVNSSSFINKNEVIQLCKPLLELIGVQHCSFTLFYNNGGLTRFSTCPEWTQHYYKQEYYKVIPKINKNNAKSHYSIWDYLSEDTNADFIKVLKEAKEFNLFHGFTTIRCFKDFKVACSLASPLDARHINDKYLNSISSIESFIYYFLNKAHPLIESDRRKKSSLNQYQTAINTNENKPENAVRASNHFNESLTINKLYLKDVLLTKQETLCLVLAMMGKTSKKIAKELSLSARTVDFYIDNIKSKVDCFDRNALIETAFECETLRGMLLGVIPVPNKRLLA